MDEAVIKEIARQIFTEQILLNWKFYALLAVTHGVFAAAKSFGSKYFEKRGEILATKADFDEILRQLQKSTETAEGIKTTLAHKDWSEKEYKMLRRVKLEELLSAVHEVEHWQGEVSTRVFVPNSEQTSIQPVLYRVKLLSTLYFPELQQQYHTFAKKCADIGCWAADLRLAVVGVPSGSPRFDELFRAHKEAYQKHRLELRGIVRDIEQKAEELMTALIMA